MSAPDMTQEAKPAPMFEPFRWVYPEHVAPVLPTDRVLKLSELAHDVAGGAAIIMKILERIDIDADGSAGEFPPLLAPVEASRLQRLAIVSLEMLRDAAEDFHFAVIDQHPRKTSPTSQG